MKGEERGGRHQQSQPTTRAYWYLKSPPASPRVPLTEYSLQQDRTVICFRATLLYEGTEVHGLYSTYSTKNPSLSSNWYGRR
jgi:hypothetical protein